MSESSDLNKLLDELDRARIPTPNAPYQRDELPPAIILGALGGGTPDYGLDYTGSSGSAPRSLTSGADAPSADNPTEGGATRNSDGNYERPLTEVCEQTPCLAGCPDSTIKSKCPENFADDGITHTSDGTIYKQSDWDKYFTFQLTIPEGDWSIQWKVLARQRLKYFRGKSVEYLKRKYGMRIIDAFVDYTLAYWSERRGGNFIHNPGREGYYMNNGGFTTYMVGRIEEARTKAREDENKPPASDEVRPPRTSGSGSGSGSRGQPTPISQNPKIVAFDALVKKMKQPEVLDVYSDYGWKNFTETSDWIYTKRVKAPNFEILPKPSAPHPKIWDEIKKMALDYQNDKRAFLEIYTVTQIEDLEKRLYAFNKKAKAMNKLYPFSEWINDALREMKTIDAMRLAGFPDNINKKIHPNLEKWNLLWNWERRQGNPYGYDLATMYFNYDSRSIIIFKSRIKEGALYYSDWQRLMDEYEAKGLKINPLLSKAENQRLLSLTPNQPTGRTARWFYKAGKGWFDDTSFLFKKGMSGEYKFKGRIEDIESNPEWVWKEFGALIQQDVATMKRLFYNDPMAVITKYIADWYYLNEKTMVTYYTKYQNIGLPNQPKKISKQTAVESRVNWGGDSSWYPNLLMSLIKQVIRRSWRGDPITKLYFYPSQILKTLGRRDRRTNQVDSRKVNFWRGDSAQAWGVNDLPRDMNATGRNIRGTVPTPPAPDKAPRTDIDKRRLIDEIKANIAQKKPINSEKQSLINRAKLMGVTFTEDPNLYTIVQLQKAIQNYWRQGEGYKPALGKMKEGAMDWRDWATKPLSIIEQYGMVGLSGQGDENNKHFLLNALVAKYVYLPTTLRPTPLLGKWFYEKSLSTKNVSVYRHRSRNEIKIGIRGTKDGFDFLTDTTVILGILDLTKYIDGILGYDSYVVRLKKALDRTLKKYPRDKWEYSMSGHSLGGLGAVFTDLWLQNEYMEKNGQKQEDRNGYDKYILPQGVTPYKHIQISTFDAGAGLEQLVRNMVGFMNSLADKYEPKPSMKSSKIKLRQYRIAGDLVSLAGKGSSAYSSAESYSLTFQPKCPEQGRPQLGGEGHSMGQFLHNNFLPEKDKIKCRTFGETGLRPRGTGARRGAYNPARYDPNV